MKRKQFLYTAIGAASVANMGAGRVAQLDGCELPNIRWRMATSWPQSLTIYGGAENVCQGVSKMTNGRFTITPYPAGQVVQALEVLDAVQDGTVECGHTASYYYTKKEPALAFATGVPFGLNAQQQNAWLYYGGGLKEIQKIYAKLNVINFPAGNTGMQMGGWFNREVNTLKDLEGLKMRIPGLGADVMAKLGVEVKNIASNEILQALEQGTIDAAEWIGPHDDLKLGLHKVAKYYYSPGWWEQATTLDVLVNLDKWNDLPQIYKEIFQTAAFEANGRMLAEYDVLNQTALIELLHDDKPELKIYSNEIMEEARKKTIELYDENANKYTSFSILYENWKRFRENICRWDSVINKHQFGELSFYCEPL